MQVYNLKDEEGDRITRQRKPKGQRGLGWLAGSLLSSRQGQSWWSLGCGISTEVQACSAGAGDAKPPLAEQSPPESSAECAGTRSRFHRPASL